MKIINFKIKKYSRKLSVRAAFYAVTAVAGAMFSFVASPLVPQSMSQLVDIKAVQSVLEILASSMLVVVTFSLSTMVAAYASASEQVTPRAARILMEENSSQNSLSTFLGAFIFSIVSIFALSTGVYDKGGLFILFFMTVTLLLVIVFTIVRWIENISKLGRVHETILKIEKSALPIFIKLAEEKSLGCRTTFQISDELPVLKANQNGYVQDIDFAKLSLVAEENNISIFILIGMGSLMNTERPMVRWKNKGNEDLTAESKKKIQDCFMIGKDRSFDNDGRFHFVVLSEVASKALSPAVNDPGTAIEVISSMLRIFSAWGEKITQNKIKYPNVYFAEISISDCLDDIIKPISRDGAANIEVLIKLIKALEFIKKTVPLQQRDIIDKYKKIVYDRGNQILKFSEDKETLLKI